MEAKEIIYPQFKGLYKVYNNGSVLNIKTNRFLKPYIEPLPYNRSIFILYNKGLKKAIGASKLIADHFINKPNDYKTYILVHKDGNRLINSVTNLVYLTSLERNKLKNTFEKIKPVSKNKRKCYIMCDNIRIDFNSTKELQDYLHIRKITFQRLVNSIGTYNGFIIRYV